MKRKTLIITHDINGGEYVNVVSIEFKKSWKQLDNTTVLVDGLKLQVNEVIVSIEEAK